MTWMWDMWAVGKGDSPAGRPVLYSNWSADWAWPGTLWLAFSWGKQRYNLSQLCMLLIFIS